DTHDYVLGCTGHQLVDRGPYAGAHRLDVSQKALIAGLDGLLFDRQSRHVIGDATRAKRLAFRADDSVGRGHNDADLLTKRQCIHVT
ncbi:MAG: hypothetical protein PSV22_04990, partial [Pseudolabrys sp.]|nr:hypothetical protein [Pseudolabrys sp.]